MNVGILVVDPLQRVQEMRLKRMAHAGHMGFHKIKAERPVVQSRHELYILASRGLDLSQNQAIAAQIKEQIGDAPLFWFNETCLDVQARDKVSLEQADGFFPPAEFESILTEIYKLEDVGEIESIQGVVINQNGRAIEGSPRSSSRRSLHEAFHYVDEKQALDHEGYYSIVPALGCSKRCHNCSILSREGFRRSLNAYELVDYLEGLYKKSRIRKFRFLDQSFNTNAQELRKFCEAIIERELKIEFKADFLVEKTSENLFNLLKEAGLHQANITLFTGSDRVAWHNNIEARNDLTRKFLSQFAAVKIPVKLNVKVGLPYEQYVDFFRTVRFLESVKHNVKEIEVSTAQLDPNSYFARNMEKHRISLEPGSAKGWIKPEKDHLNEPSSREQKRQFLQKLASNWGLYSHKLEITEDLSEIETRQKESQERFVDAVLVNCPPWGYLNPPVGLAKISAYARSKGYQTKILDYNVGLFRKYEEMQRLWHVENKSYWSNDITFDIIRHIYEDDIEEAIEEILDYDGEIIGFSCVDPKERMTVDFIKRLRERSSELTIILGGPVCGTTEYRNIFFDKLGASGVDCYVVGEGEDTLIEIIEKVKSGKSLKGIPGTVEVDEDGNWHFAPVRAKVDLWNSPISTYEEFDLDDYSCQELILEWSRGCIGTCAFCKAKVLDGKFRSYSPEHVVESLKYYVDNYNITVFTIADLAVNGNWKLLEKICDKIIESGIKVELRAQGIPRRQMTLPILKKMKEAGFSEMQWGVESGSDKVLAAMDKEWMFTIDEAQQVLRDSYMAGIKTCMFCMVGYPTEEEGDFQMTYDFIDRNAEYLDMVKSVNSLHIITDTPVHHMVEKFGLTLPSENYHYLWSMPGNDHDVRQERVKRLLELIKLKNLECLETNYLEGRQFVLMEDYKSQYIPMEERVSLLRRDINMLIDYRMNEQESYEDDVNPKDLFLEKNRDLIGVTHGKRAIQAPRIVEIDLSNNCNFNCVGCWCHCDHLQELKTPAQRKKNHINLDTLKSLIKDLAENGTKIVQLAGPGEPFTHPQIMDIIRYVKGNGLELHIITNFSYITHEIAQELIDLKVDQITCSLWAGSPEAFVKTHPNQDEKAFQKIKEVLTFIGNNKKYNYYPRIKIFNVINRLNSFDVENMVNYGLEVRADTMEFTVVDTVPGKTDFLALDLDDLEKIETAFNSVVKRATYPDPPGRKHLKGLSPEQMEEHYEVNAKFFTDVGDYQGFEYEPLNKVMTCKAGIANERMEHDPFDRCSNVFFWRKETCLNCKHFESCEVDKQDISIKTRFFAVLGFGSFVRRAKLSVHERLRREGRPVPGEGELLKQPAAVETSKVSKAALPKTPFVDTMPCTIGWTYARITTDGNVIPCCKGYEKPLGNLYQNHFKYIWNDGPYMEFRHKAKSFKKSDAYFEEIGCYKACDNVGHNLEIVKRLNSLQTREKKWLEEAAAELR